MAKKKSNSKPVFKNRPVKKSIPKTTKTALIDRIDSKIEQNHTLLKWMITILSFLFAMMMFEGKVSVGFDDALYIQSANNYVEDFFGYWYTSNAPLYVLILAIPIAIFGVNLTVIKILTVLFFSFTVYKIYQTFHKRIPGSILLFSVLTYATNWAALSYASLTYQESFFILVQILFLGWFFKFIDRNNFESFSLKPAAIYQPKTWLALGTFLFILHFTRTVAIAALGATIVYFLWFKKFKSILITIISFSIVYFAVNLIKNVIWGTENQLSQADIILRVDPYNADKGYETVGGFVNRFFGNIEIYFSQRFLEVLSFRAIGSPRDLLFTILTIIPIGFGVVVSIIRGNKYLFYTALYCLAMCALTFIVLQTSWGQLRLILIYLPYFLMLSYFGLREIFKFKYIRNISILFFIPLLIVFSINISRTFQEVIKQFPETEAYFVRGDRYKGFSPDWVNYLKMSEWCGNNLENESFVACRKAPMSFIYANGKKFYLISSANTTSSPEEKLQKLKESGVTHIIFARLRVNESVKTDRYINTIHRYWQPIQQQFPNALTKVHEIGSDEKATLYKINY